MLENSVAHLVILVGASACRGNAPPSAVADRAAT